MISNGPRMKGDLVTYDVVALIREPPDQRAVLDALGAVGEELLVDVLEHGGVIQLCDAEGGTLLSIEEPVLIQVRGEAERLLGPVAAGLDPPLWWVEARAAERDGARDRARVFAGALVAGLGGVVWDPEEHR